MADEFCKHTYIRETDAELDRALDRCQELRAQNAALRSALEEIRDDRHQEYDEHNDSSYALGVADGHRCAADKARAAISAPQEPAR